MRVRKFLGSRCCKFSSNPHQTNDLIPLENAIEEMKRAKANGEIGEEADCVFI